MTVTLRQKKRKKISLFLDYYDGGNRKYEYLKLYLEPNPKTKEQREQNKKTLQLAEAIRARRQLEIQAGEFGFQDQEKLKESFIGFMRQLTEKRRASEGNYGNWDSVVKHLEKFAPKGILFGDLNYKLVERFKEYLENEAKSRGTRPLSQNTKASYFNKFRAGIKQAVRDGYLPSNPSEAVKGFKQGEPQREFLSLEELQACANTECEIPLLKQAFLFSCLTGLRWSDIQKLIWGEIQRSNELGDYIRFRQKKTKGSEVLPISDQAISLLGIQGDPDQKVFQGLKYSAWNNLKLQQWVMAAGISKTITFHCARHTYATLQLSMGTDIYTVSKLLGHRELKTTQIYAQVIDEKKKEAANKIQLEL